jgi:hypothetical protein
MSTTLIDIFREQLKLEEKLQNALDDVVPPAGRFAESWTLAWVGQGEHDVELEIALEPPDGAVEWHYPTIERLQTLQQQLACDRIHAVPMDKNEIRYIASYDREKNSEGPVVCTRCGRVATERSAHGIEESDITKACGRPQ